MTNNLLGYVEGIVSNEPRKWDSHSLPVILCVDSRYSTKSLEDAKGVVAEAEKIGLISRVQTGLPCELGTYELRG